MATIYRGQGQSMLKQGELAIVCDRSHEPAREEIGREPQQRVVWLQSQPKAKVA